MGNNRRKLKRNAVHFFVFCVLVFGLANEVKSKEKILTVDVEITAPCVMHYNGTYTGFDIELWEEIAQELKLAFTYNETDLKGIFADLVGGKADVAFSCITVTNEREKIVDFSHHYFDSGLRILVSSKTTHGTFRPFKSLLSPFVLTALIYLVLFIFIAGNILWFVERGHFHVSQKYFPGIFDAIWFVVVTMATVGYGDVVPRKWFGRLVSIFVMVLGIGFFGWVVAQLSSALTLQKLHSDIEHPRDLRERVVATVEGTTSVPTLHKLGAIVKPTKTIEDAYRLLLEKKVEAVVFDSPAILYFERNDGAGKVKAVGPLFDIQYYGFLFPQGSELRESVNRALLKLRKNGIYDRLYRKWFGSG
jgi:polar amino acid transport system substrate-binding protein